MGGDPAPRPYQRVDAGQGVVGVVQGVEQLINPVVGLAVPVEADTDSRAAGGEGTPNQRRGKRSPRHGCLAFRPGRMWGHKLDRGHSPEHPGFGGPPTPGRAEPEQMG